MNGTAYDKSLATDSLNYARKFLLTLLEIDHRLNQLCCKVMKLETDVSTIYRHIMSKVTKSSNPN